MAFRKFCCLLTLVGITTLGLPMIAQALGPNIILYSGEKQKFDNLITAREWLFEKVATYNEVVLSKFEMLDKVDAEPQLPPLFKSIEGSSAAELYGWVSLSEVKTSTSRWKATHTFVPVFERESAPSGKHDELLLGGFADTEVLAGLIHTQIERFVKSDSGKWVKEFVGYDEDYYVLAHLKNYWALTPEESNANWWFFVKTCDSAKSKMKTKFKNDDEFKIYCDPGEQPKDSDGDHAADSGLPDKQIETILDNLGLY